MKCEAKLAAHGEQFWTSVSVPYAGLYVRVQFNLHGCTFRITLNRIETHRQQDTKRLPVSTSEISSLSYPEYAQSTTKQRFRNFQCVKFLRQTLKHLNWILQAWYPQLTQQVNWQSSGLETRCPPIPTRVDLISGLQPIPENSQDNYTAATLFPHTIEVNETLVKAHPRWLLWRHMHTTYILSHLSHSRPFMKFSLRILMVLISISTFLSKKFFFFCTLTEVKFSDRTSTFTQNTLRSGVAFCFTGESVV